MTAGQPLAETRAPRRATGPAAAAPVAIRDLLHMASQRLEGDFETAVGGGSLTSRQAFLLATLARHEGASQTTLVDRTGVDRSTLADMVRRLQRKGLLQRRRTREDARAYAVKLTDEGRRILKRAAEIGAEADRQTLGVLTAAEQRTLADLLGKLAHADSDKGG